MSSGPQELKGAARVLDLADRMRASGGVTPHRLHHECTEALQRGEISFDDVTPLYRHAMIHAGAIVPRDRERYRFCPECTEPLT